MTIAESATLENWLLLGAMVFVSIFAIGCSFYNRHLQTARRRQAGPLLLQVTRPRVRRWEACFLVFFGIVTVMNWALLLWKPIEPLDVALRTGYTMVPLVAVWSYWSRGAGDIEIREHGLVSQGAFWSWDDFRSYSWVGDGPKLRLRMKGQVADFRIAAEQKEGIDRLLREHLPPGAKTEQHAGASSQRCGVG